MQKIPLSGCKVFEKKNGGGLENEPDNEMRLPPRILCRGEEGKSPTHPVAQPENLCATVHFIVVVIVGCIIILVFVEVFYGVLS